VIDLDLGGARCDHTYTANDWNSATYDWRSKAINLDSGSTARRRSSPNKRPLTMPENIQS